VPQGGGADRDTGMVQALREIQRQLVEPDLAQEGEESRDESRDQSAQPRVMTPARAPTQPVSRLAKGRLYVPLANRVTVGL
jgi:hypothetical protein